MSKISVTACGLLFCYNEEHILEETLKYYLSQGIDVVVVDNCSTDSSPEIVRGFQDKDGRYPGHVIDTIKVETDGYQWARILKAAEDYMHERLSGYDWILQIDADGFYQSPVKGLGLRDFMGAVERFGYNIIDGKWFDFHPTEVDDPSVESPIERMRFCRVEPYGPLPQHKIFRYHPTVDFHASLGHEVDREDPRVAPVKYIYRHFPWVSFEHGVKKIFKDRKPRYVERKDNPLYHVHYLEMLPREDDLIKRSADLHCFDEAEEMIARPAFYRLLIRDRLAPAGKAARVGARKARSGACLARRFFQVLKEDGMGVFGRTAGYVGRRLKPTGAQTHACATGEAAPARAPEAAPARPEPPAASKTVTEDEIKARRASAVGFPHTYHFLMTTACNARCVFCNQDPSQPLGEITLEKFKQMISHMPVESARYFYLSGGGDPLVCRDFFPILRYINEELPWVRVHVRTNGLLVKKYARELAAQDLRLEISVHGASDETNNHILGTKRSGDIFEGVGLLNEILAKEGRCMDIAFFPALFRSNIHELPELIRKAAELKVGAVESYFCRCYVGEQYQGEGRITESDSLFYSQDEYDEVIGEAERLAASLGVCFMHEARFSDEFCAKPCFEPWRMMLVDWNGEVFPCCGGEMWFKGKVDSGEYHFGNLLSEDLYKFWNNETYVAIRRTLSPYYADDLMPECANCHSLLCFEGPHARDGHIIDRPSSATPEHTPAHRRTSPSPQV